MKIKDAYSIWSKIYDSNKNKTRDLEGTVMRQLLKDLSLKNCLEIGCGTGKNTCWLAAHCSSVKALDLTSEMLEIAQQKVTAKNVNFEQADILEDWKFADKKYDLITFSLVLEHIENLDAIFQKMESVIANNGYVYIGELHPFKQYTGSKARFETENGTEILTSFTHHISEFTGLAKRFNYEIVELEEFFDESDRNGIPRILGMVLRKI